MATPTKLTWEAPIQREDGSPITADELGLYELGVDGSPFAQFPGTLNQEGRYEVAIADLALEPRKQTVALRVYDLEGRVSEWSNTLELDMGKPPMAPASLRAA